ncbi:hypothetical protein TNCV_1109011 [Trichonephila clavipes]|nr:hypothetical protein TNCV_1109011 [Trichonephila clavipes]
MNKIRKTPAGLDCLTLSSKEFTARNDDSMCKAPIIVDRSILKFVQRSKNIIDTIDSVGVNEMNNAVPVPTSSEMRNIMKSMRSYLDPNSNGEMTKKMDVFEHFVNTI